MPQSLFARCPNFVWIKVAGFHSALAKRGKQQHSPLLEHPCAAREVVDPHKTKKIPNGSTAHPCALRALTIIPDGYTVF
ncbi:hypothetical protein SHDE107825_01295 [Shewanella denitrificans]|jgi:hypothetical protein